jgi:hypothetical protein
LRVLKQAQIEHKKSKKRIEPVLCTNLGTYQRANIHMSLPDLSIHLHACLLLHGFVTKQCYICGN